MTPDALASLHAKCFTTPRPWSAAEFASFEDSAFLLTQPHGFLLGRVIADEAELLTLAVDPAARRQGIARGLLDGFKTTATDQGATVAFLEVAANNLGALALYEAAGFKEAGRRRAYYKTVDGPALDALVLRCLLGAQ